MNYEENNNFHNPVHVYSNVLFWLNLSMIVESIEYVSNLIALRQIPSGLRSPKLDVLKMVCEYLCRTRIRIL